MAITKTKPPPWIVGWRDIAAAMKVSVPTARRRERKEGLPICRSGKIGEGMVWIICGALEDWMKRKKINPAAQTEEGEG